MSTKLHIRSTANSARAWSDKGFSKGYGEAYQDASDRLQEALAIAVEVIPCPACGWYQSHMMPMARTCSGAGSLAASARCADTDLHGFHLAVIAFPL